MSSQTTRIIQRFAYQYIGNFFEDKLDKFENLKRDLRKAGMDISLRMYLSMAVFKSIVGAVAGSIITLIFVLIFKIPFTFVIIDGLLIGILVYVVAMITPASKIGERKRKLDASLPSAASYMAAMSSAGVTPDEIFYSLSRDEINLFVSEDAKKISRDIKIFGLDIVRALDNAARRSPSPKYTSFLEGINATNTSGGDLQSYFENASKNLMRDKLQSEKGFVELLGLFAELFLVACIVTPTMGVVLLAVAALQGTMNHQELVTLVIVITFILIPILQSMIIIMVDGSQPQE
ncbi:MAG: type II secretion system F family protein [Candidatus Heimdallarchaeota archaeon]|nr:type II secretion system F family protein [Candidatus Heimdallarchaeota archaeon]MDH5645226.1 type II secretion system F family protein [Candidatus Heimdallarchaeota archaeon]